MSHYWKRCPHCGHTVENGYGLPIKRFGDPQKRCRYCSEFYIDRDIIDWETASLVKKLLYYLSNGRFFLCFIPYVILTARVGSKYDLEDWKVYLFCLPVFCILFFLCVVYVKIQVRLHYGKIDKKPKNISTEERYEKYQNGLFADYKSKNK